jgi:simple sugar transport system ATP-binding protein
MRTGKAELRDIRKVFDSGADSGGEREEFLALDGVSLDFLSGEVHAILGENGAGKSTLVNILSGLQSPTSGQLHIDGAPLRFGSPADALAAGIAMVHQRPLLAEELTVLDNILLGSDGFFMRRRQRQAAISEVASHWVIQPRYGALARDCTPSDRLRTALVAALWRRPQFLVLDEPTAILAPTERAAFLRSMREESERGTGVILITHKIDEALTWSDRVSILRKGRLVFSARVSPALDDRLVASYLFPAETGATPTATSVTSPATSDATVTSETTVDGTAKTNSASGGEALAVTNLTARPANRAPIENVAFTADAGKITAILGWPGAGLDTLEDALSGMIRAESATVTLGTGARFDPATLTPAALRAAGIAIVPSDRTFRAAHPDLTVAEALTAYNSAGLLLDRRANERLIRRICAGTHVHVRPNRPMRTLSGGQQQRLILARELETQPRVLILAEPEWGLDAASAARLRETLSRRASEGMTVLILTADLDARDDRSFFDKIYELKEGRLA